MNQELASVGRLVGACDPIAIGEFFYADINGRVLRRGEQGCEKAEREGDGEETRVGHLRLDE